jgi:hypothetical protein
MKQTHAQQPLGFLNLLGERGRRNLQLLSRAGKVEVPRNAHKASDMAKFEFHCINVFVNNSVILR